MPLDTSIISSYNPGAAPDVNAMLTQQMQGMQNINTLERQRAQDALDMQDRAAAQAKEQEAVAIKALLPAYTYGIQTGDIAGAGNLVPPEMRGQLQPYLDALAGQPPEAVKSALIGSLASSGEVGQKALEAIQRAGTLSVQQGQLDVSREDLKLRRQKQALDAQGKGAWELKEGEGGFFWTNPRTREVVPADVTGSAISGAVPAPNVVTPRQPAPGAPEVEAPISTAQPPAEFKPKVKPVKEDDFTEAEAKSVNFAPRMIFSDKIVNDLEAEGTVTTDAVSNFFTGLASSLPLAAGSNLAVQLESAFNAASPTMSPEEQRLANAQLDFITAILRSESGAEIKTSEFPAEYRKYFAVEGDENNTNLLADKRRRRKLAIEGMKARAGKQGRAEIDRIATELIDGGAGSGVPAAPGATLDGFEYQGVED